MQVPTVSIKIKGLKALEALGTQNNLLAGLNLKGAGAATAKMKGLGAGAGQLVDFETKRVFMTPDGVRVVQEFDGHVLLNGKGATKVVVKGGKGAASTVIVKGGKGAAKTVIVKGAVAKGALATSPIAQGAIVTKGPVVVKVAAAKSAMVPGAALSAKGLGWSLGLGGLGPWLALGAVGLAATGVYLYLRARNMEQTPDEDHDFEAPL